MIGYYLKGLLELLLLPIKIGWLVPWFIMTGFGICASICMYMSWRDSTMYMWSVHYFPGLFITLLQNRKASYFQFWMSALVDHLNMLWCYTHVERSGFVSTCQETCMNNHWQDKPRMHPRNLYEQPLTSETNHACGYRLHAKPSLLV